MRIIAGRFKGRLIVFPKHIRPTQDKVRQSIFDVLAPVIKESRVLDLFAGSGAFGLEALSRGAGEVIFIDNDARSVRAILKNFEGLDLNRWQSLGVACFKQDVFRAIKILKKKGRSFDVVFLDPPYHKGLAKKALQSLVGSGILATRSFIIVEHARKDLLGSCPEGLQLIKEVAYADKGVSFYRRG
jgi:16S rRNA (guanine966-N2)-methyltransferase